jgi:propanol-preferring alcohol dehydrogenase
MPGAGPEKDRRRRATPATTMRAIRITAWEQPPELCEIAAPAAPPGGAVLEVRGAGLCHSDLHLMHWPAGTLPHRLPFTLGHEVAGTVVELGPGADGVALGDEVLVLGRWDPGPSLGLGADGGLADRVAVPDVRYLVPAAGLDPVSAAPLTDAALTPYHAIRAALPVLRPGATSVVIGIGGLGHAAVQLLGLLSQTRVVAVDRRPEALAIARDAGADAALDATVLDGPALRAEVGRAGAAFVMDCVGTDPTMALAAAAIGPGGRVALVGIGGGTFPMRFGTVPFEATVTFPNWGTHGELVDVVALARGGHLALEVEPVALEGVVDAYARLDRGQVTGRVVAVP